MDNKEKYQNIFVKSLALNENKFNENIKYNEVSEWDSIGHMTLMSGLEEGFGITMETDDIVEFSSYKKGIEILKKYKVVLIVTDHSKFNYKLISQNAKYIFDSRNVIKNRTKNYFKT